MQNLRAKSISRLLLVKNRYFDNFVFIHINKTGGSSVAQALNIPQRHRTAQEMIEEIGQNNWDRRLTFAIVRNPWDKVVSHYHYRESTNQTGLRENPIDFAEWVKRTYGAQDPIYYDQPKMFMPQVHWITDKEGMILVDEILRFENLDRDFNELMQKMGKKKSLPHVKKSIRGDYHEYYDEETIKIVRDWFARDIERFEYQY